MRATPYITPRELITEYRVQADAIIEITIFYADQYAVDALMQEIER